MHVRNKVVQETSDLGFLSKVHNPLKKFVVNGRVDFSTNEAVIEYNKAILKSIFGLDVEIPFGNLVPTIASRVDYVLYLEDLLILSGVEANDDPISIVDVGTGCACIYPLIGSKMHQTWSFVATEIDQRSFESACKNVEMNGLSGRITILKIDDQRANLLPHLSEVKPHLVMCNPPFYDPEEEQVKKAIKRARINYTNGEGFYPGGEVAFVKRMIEESLLRPEVFFFSAIIGIKRHLMVLEEYLRMIEEKSVVKIFSSLVGRTRRWILAWSFNPSVIKRMRSKRAFFDVSDLKELGIVSDDGIVYHVKKVNWTRKSRRMKKVEDMQECDFKFTLEEAPKLLCEETVENQILFNSLINHLNNKKRGTI